MIDLRFIQRDGKRVLQWRQVRWQETLIDGQFVARVDVTEFPRAPAWTAWVDVPTEQSFDDSAKDWK